MFKTPVTTKRSTQSTTTKKRLASSTIKITSAVVISVSRRVGQVTLPASARTSCRNSNGLVIVLACRSVKEVALAGDGGSALTMQHKPARGRIENGAQKIRARNPEATRHRKPYNQVREEGKFNFQLASAPHVPLRSPRRRHRDMLAARH